MIYYIYDQANNAVKIGYATSKEHVWRRYENLQVGNITPFIMLHYEEGSQKDEAFKHKQFAKLRVRGEWFLFIDELRDYLQLEIDPNSLDVYNANDMRNYHIKKFGHNTDITYMRVLSSLKRLKKESANMSELTRICAKVNNVDELDDMLSTYLKIDFSELHNHFVKKEGNVITVSNMKKYLKNYKFCEGSLSVSKLAEAFNVKYKNLRVDKKIQRCIVGLAFKKDLNEEV